MNKGESTIDPCFRRGDIIRMHYIKDHTGMDNIIHNLLKPFAHPMGGLAFMMKEIYYKNKQ